MPCLQQQRPHIFISLHWRIPNFSLQCSLVLSEVPVVQWNRFGALSIILSLMNETVSPSVQNRLYDICGIRPWGHNLCLRLQIERWISGQLVCFPHFLLMTLIGIWRKTPENFLMSVLKNVMVSILKEDIRNA